MKIINRAAACIALMALLSACAGGTQQAEEPVSESVIESSTQSEAEEPADSPAEEVSEESSEESSEEIEESSKEGENVKECKLKIGETVLSVEWEDNESVKALQTMAEDGGLHVELSMYGGFEQVGSLGTSLPREDVQTQTQAGDIVLYSGDQIVIFYGSNSWAYTRLGRIKNATPEEMASLLGQGDTSIDIYFE